jgi:dTDP-4-amino-4,6-dideoxygalactose transaminase
MPEWHRRRLENANRIWTAASATSGLRVPVIPEYIEHAAYKCYVFVGRDTLRPGWDRDRIMAEINALSVPCFSGSCSEVYLEKAFDSTGFRPPDRLPIARELGETSLMFLCHPTLTDDDLDRTCAAIEKVMAAATR